MAETLEPPAQCLPRLYRARRLTAETGNTIDAAELAATTHSEPADPQALDLTHYTVLDPIPAGIHVLLIDGTWTSGGHALPAALALRAAGAATVSLLVVAR